MNLPYLLPRVVRHFLPERLVRFLLLRSWVIQPGLETSDPEAAVRRYAEVLATHDLTLKGRRVLVFGYGGRFDIGVGLLEAGAESVVLCEKYAPPDDSHNRTLLPRYDAYLGAGGLAVRPSSARMQLLQADIREVQAADLAPADLVISNSVYEHLGDVEGITRALARVTEPDGLHIHFVDLRDHYFKYPFEMLCYSESTWRTWLNPSSNHNRYRLWDYRKAFETCFERVDLTVLARDEAEFDRIRPRVRPEFTSGDAGQDSVTLIQVVGFKPLRAVHD